MDGLELIVTETDWVAVVLTLSFTCAVNVKGPAAVGVPLSAPVDVFNVTPVGSDPEVSDHVYGVVPPPAVNV